MQQCSVWNNPYTLRICQKNADINNKLAGFDEKEKPTETVGVVYPVAIIEQLSFIDDSDVKLWPL